MNKLSKEKRDHLILVTLITAIVAAGLWFGLIKFQNGNLRLLASKKQAAEQTLRDVENAIKTADRLEAELAEASRSLSELEESMASGDLYAWMINTILQFKLAYKVEIPQFSTILPGEMGLLPRFPYKQVTMTINGSAYFHDLGKFISDFENRFPHIRIQNLEMEPVSGLVSGDREKLTFKMDIVALIKSGTR